MDGWMGIGTSEQSRRPIVSQHVYLRLVGGILCVLGSE
jgi:hypothetical protein